MNVLFDIGISLMLFDCFYLLLCTFMLVDYSALNDVNES